MELDDEVDAGPVATVRYAMDDAYLREFHAERVATQLPRWRMHRRGAMASGVLALGLLGWSATTGRLDALFLGLLVLSGAVAMGLRLHRRRERWLEVQRSQSTFGARIAVALDRGRLIQTSDRDADAIAIPGGEIVESPRGWFVTYDTIVLGTEITDPAVSTARSAAYLPHGACEPALSRDDFANALEGTFRVRRRGAREA